MVERDTTGQEQSKTEAGKQGKVQDSMGSARQRKVGQGRAGGHVCCGVWRASPFWVFLN